MSVTKGRLLIVFALAVVINTVCSEYDGLFMEKRSSKTVTLKDATQENVNSILLDRHNELRKEEAINATAAYMYKMAYSKTLAQMAKKWIGRCVYKHAPYSYRKSNEFDWVNDNLYIAWSDQYSVANAVNLWFGEKKDYNFKTRKCTPGEMCGHYTQVVWGESKYLGCAIKFCKWLYFPKERKAKENHYYISCMYGPGGNTIGRDPYAIGKTTCEKCPKNCVEKALCDTKFKIKFCRDEASDCIKDYCYSERGLKMCQKTCGKCKENGESVENEVTLEDATQKTVNSILLKRHNELRKEEAINETAAYMFKMAHSKELAQMAKKWVDRCVYAHADGEHRKSKNFDWVNDNLYISWAGLYTVKNVVEQWFNEKNDYNFQTMKCKPGKKCGHYTQVVWGESKYLGCAIKFCPRIYMKYSRRYKHKVYYVSCMYGPGGNYVGRRPYGIGKSTCEKCPNNCVENALCATDFKIKFCRDEASDCIKDYCYSERGLKMCQKTCGKC